jgi:MFS family permease
MQTQAATAPRDGVWSPPRRALTLGLFLTITLVGFEGMAVGTVMPVVSDDLGGLALYGWVFSAFFLGNLVGIVVAGRDADMHGPARAFVAGLVLFSAGLLGAGLAPHMFGLVLARLVQGLGAGAIPAILYVAVGRSYPLALQPRMFAIISTAWVLPAIIGPAIAGVAADTIGWRWVFLGLLPFVVMAGWMTVPSLRRLGPPGGDDPADRRLDAVVLAIGAALVLGGASAQSPIIVVVLVAVGLGVASRAVRRLMPAGTLRLAPGLPAAVLLRGLTTFAFFGTDAYVSLTLTSVHDTSTTFAGAALTGAALGWTSGSWVQERFAGRVGPSQFVRRGALIMLIGIAGMIAVATLEIPVGFAIVAWTIAGLGMGMAYTPPSLVVLSEAPPGGEGMATASLQLSDTLGIALGTGTAGAIVAAGDAFGWSAGNTLALAFVLCSAVALMVAAGAQRLPRRPTVSATR